MRPLRTSGKLVTVPFPATRWSVVLAARSRDEGGRLALAELCAHYWSPLYAFARRHGHDPDASADLVQGFFAHLLEGSGLAGIEHGRARFRSYLLGAFVHHIARLRERAAAQKRGGGTTVVDFDTNEAERRMNELHGDALGPEEVFTAAWAHAVLARAEARLAEQYARRGATALLEALRPRLFGGDEALVEIATSLGMKEGAVKVALFRLRRRYGDAVRAEVAETVADPAEVDAELRSLMAALGSANIAV